MSASPVSRAFPGQRQRGLTFIGLLFVVFVIGALALLAMRIAPSAIEYQAVLKAVERARSQPTPVSARAAFDRSAQIDDITSISGKDLEITPAANNAPGVSIAFSYRKELPLFGPASLLLHYTGSAH